MDNVIAYLGEREAEFGRHLAVARMVESRIDMGTIEGSISVEVRHLNTIKSGLFIHLYNIVEATLTRVLDEVGQGILMFKPIQWKEDILKEWVRGEVWSSEGINVENAIDKFAGFGGRLASGMHVDQFRVKGVPGSWNDDAVKRVSKRLNCQLLIRSAKAKEALRPVYENDTTALKFLSGRRNALAHGGKTFEDGATDKTLAEITELADRVLAYLLEVVKSYQKFLADKEFVKQVEVAE